MKAKPAIAGLVICLCTAAFAGNELATTFPAGLLHANFEKAYVSLEPLGSARLENSSGYSWPGFLYAVFLPAQIEDRDMVAPSMVPLAPPHASITNIRLPEIAVRVNDQSPLDTAGALLVIDLDTISDADPVLSADTLSFSLPEALDDGLHEISVSIPDSAGNRGIYSWSFTIDSEADSLTIVKIPQTRVNIAEYPIYGTAGAGDSVFVLLAGQLIDMCRADTTTGSYEFGTLSLPQGNVEIVIYSRDAAGNTSPGDTTKLLVDTNTPLLSLNTAKGRLNGDTLLTGLPLLVFQFTDTISGLDTSTIGIVFNGDSVEFRATSFDTFALAKRTASAQNIGIVNATYRTPRLENGSRVWLKVFARDNNLNRMQDSLSFVVAKTDSMPPTIGVGDTTQSLLASTSDTLTIVCSAADSQSNLFEIGAMLVPGGHIGTPVDSQLVFTATCTTASSDTFRLAVSWIGPEFAKLFRGFTCVAQATDEYGNIAFAAPKGVRMQYDNYAQLEVVPEKWQMFSVPFEQSRAYDSITNEFGDYDQTRWRWTRYMDNSMQEFGTDGFDSIAPGKAFWIHHRNIDTWKMPTGASVTLSPADTFAMQLTPGWNQIGNPYLYNIRWEQATFSVHDSLISLPYAYDSETDEYHRLDNLDTLAQLIPWAGYWVHNSAGDTVEMEIIPAHAACSLFAKKNLEGGWTSTIWAKSDGQASRAFFGEHPNSTPGFDTRDALLPPSPASGMRLAFCADNGQWLSTSYNALRKEKQGETFTMVLLSPPHGMGFRIEGIPGRYPCLWVWDKQYRKAHNLTDSSACLFKPIAGKKQREFEVWTGTHDYVLAKLASAKSQIPLQWALSCFPNPFNPIVRINYAVPYGPDDRQLGLRLYGPNGALVKTLANGNALPGYHSALWDAQDHAGRKVATGFYFVRLECTGTESKVFNRKILLLK